MLSGISSLGITFGWGVETVKGQKPTTFKQLHRINTLGEINIENEQIDSSALEDTVTRYIQGRGDTGGTTNADINYTPETVAEWKEVIEAYGEAKDSGLRIWFQTIIPGFEQADFVVAQPPTKIPSPAKGQNELLVVSMNLTIDEYIGFDDKVEFENASAVSEEDM